MSRYYNYSTEQFTDLSGVDIHVKDFGSADGLKFLDRAVHIGQTKYFSKIIGNFISHNPYLDKVKELIETAFV